MKKLYLVRHAKSSWDYPELSDYERPLANRGKRDAPVMAQRLRARMILPAHWISSPAIRAWQTAWVIAKGMDVPGSSIMPEPALYHAQPDEILQVIHSQSDDMDAVILFGHNPGLTVFASQVCGQDFENIPTCGVVGVSFQVNSWKNVAFHEGECLFFDYPKKTEA